MAEESAVPPGVRKYMAQIGRKGGLATGEKKGAAGWTPEQRAANGKKGVLARAQKRKKQLDGQSRLG